MIATFTDWALSALLVLGGLFGLIGSWGLIRLPDPLQRLHAPTKATTIGVGAALVAAGLDLAFTQGVISWQEALVAVFLFVTAPLSALWLARVHLWQRIPKDSLPPPASGDWATFPDDRR
ncbi:monovalent cation/H(+) antiporter subunit G [Rhodobacter sp. Har01]|uniref:monovalent cation/H(+) antiporter subunit G n=1 Tax=Rhodobacter sp. Har01 TaxID=2883999 RepID=UPI001D0915D6|nr:monovalent cation/H(+) antiporter subunit G [Rhodobacter sp. Har01]MCB6179618.1 monovalent cation/H(+) antiporter subunit G [Rhodobacter sp. Har01]